MVITAIGDAPSVPSLCPWISSEMVSTFVGLSEPDKSLNIFLQINYSYINNNNNNNKNINNN